MHLVCYLREIRERDGKSLADISSVSGLSRGLLSEIERGRRLPPDRQVADLERAYGVAAHDWYSKPALLAIQEDAD